MELCDKVDAIIDLANSWEALHSIFELLTLPVMKQLLKSRVDDIRRQMKEVNDPKKNPSCSLVYDEINHLTQSVKPITEKLPMDVMIHIIQFIIGSDGYKEMEWNLFPTLSKEFRSIMSNPCFYSKYFELHIADDNGYTKREANVSTHLKYYKKGPYFAISGQGCPVSFSSLPWKDLEIVNIECLTNQGKEYNHIPELLATLTNVKHLTIHSSLVSQPSNVSIEPLYNEVVEQTNIALQKYYQLFNRKYEANKFVDWCEENGVDDDLLLEDLRYEEYSMLYDFDINFPLPHSNFNFQSREQQIRRVFWELIYGPDVRDITWSKSAVATDNKNLYSSRLSIYPPFKNVISLSIQTQQYGDKYPYNPLSWLNGDKFPSVKFLDVPMTDKVTGDQLYESLNTFDNLSALSIRFGQYAPNKDSMVVWAIKLRIPSSVKLLMIDDGLSEIPNAAIKCLDLSECSNLMGIKSTVNIGYSNIKWPDDGHSLQFINFTFKGNDWNEVERNDIPCDMLMGECFSSYVEYNDLGKINLEQLVKYIHSDDEKDSIVKYYEYLSVNNHATRWIRRACDSVSFCRRI